MRLMKFITLNGKGCVGDTLTRGGRVPAEFMTSLYAWLPRQILPLLSPTVIGLREIG